MIINNIQYTPHDGTCLALFNRSDLERNLATACETGDVGSVQGILEKGLNPNFQTTEGATPLMLASLKGHIDIILMLLAHKANVDMQSNDKRTALMIAVRKGRMDIVKVLLAHEKVDVNARDEDGWTALMFAAREGHTEIVKALLAHEKVDVNERDEDGWTALMFAATEGHTEIVKVLLAHEKVDVNERDNNGWTALMFAARDGHTEIVQELLVHKANVDMQSNDKRTALMIAAREGHTEIVKALLAHEKIDVNARDEDGWTALMIAARKGRMDIVKVLLADEKVDVNARDEDGWTALMIAATEGHTEIVKALLQSKADICIVSRDGDSALRALRESSFPRYTQIKKERVLTAESKRYNDFHRIVRQVCHIYGIKGKSRFKTDQSDIVFKRLGGYYASYYSSIFAKNLASFLEKTTAMGEICQMLEEHASNWYVSTDELVERYARGTPILVSGGFDEHHAVYCFWKTHCILVNRGAGSRKPIEIFRIEEKTFRDPALFGGVLSKIRQIERSGTKTEFKKFVNAEFQESYYQRTDLESLLEELLALPSQTVGNCAFTGTEGIVFALLALEALHAKGLLSQGGCDAMRQGKIRDIVKQQQEIFDKFSTSLQERYAKKYRTQVPSEHQEDDILERLDWTPLKIAVRRGRTEVVQELLAHENADVNAQDYDGTTALMIAARKGHAEIVKVLLADENADVNAQDYDGTTALMFAARKGHAEIVKVLLAHENADVNAQDYDGTTALMFAAREGHTEIVKVLLAHENADVNAQDYDGTTALMFAAREGHTEIVKVLLANGAGVDTQDGDG